MSSGGGIEIRLMTAADVAGVVAVAAGLEDAPHWPETVYLKQLNPASIPQRIALVAAAATTGAVVGFAVASLVLPEAELETIGVAAGNQRQGVGRRLFDALKEKLKTAGAGTLFLEVRASNGPAIGFYGALGWTECGRRTGYYADPAEDAVLMRLALR